MSNITNGRKVALWGLTLMLSAAAVCQTQSATPVPATAMIARFVPGDSVRYEFEGIVHIAAARAQNVKLNIPDDCSYSLHAVLTIDVGHAGADGGLDGHVHFRSIRYDGPNCSTIAKPLLVKALQDLETDGTEFVINPAGDVRLNKPPAGAKFEGASILLKGAWDLLQVHLTDEAIAPGPATFSTRRFLYWPDTFVEGMQVAGTSMQYRQDANVGDRTYAWLQYKQVISPMDMPAYVEKRSQARDFTGTTFVTGGVNVSLLFDRASQRVVYLRRERKVDNRMMLKYEPNETSLPLATYSIEEESTLRWLPEKNPQAWLADLHQFESKPPRVSPTASVSAETGPSLADLADASRRQKSTKETGKPSGLSELRGHAPKGFERWERSYCSGAYCFDVSMVVPEQTKAVDNTDTTVLLLSGSGKNTVTVAVGPVLDRQYQGLDNEELLQQQSSQFVGNYLWFAGQPGERLNFESSSLGDRPAAFTDFTATARDLTPIRGRLVMVIGPYDRLMPVTCAYAATEQATLDAICQTVTSSVLIQ